MINIDYTLFLYGATVALGFVIIRYLVAAIANDERGRYEAKFLFGELLLGLILTVATSMVIEHLANTQMSNNIVALSIDGIMGNLGASNSDYIVSSDNFLDSSLSYIMKVSAYAIDVYKMDMWIAMNAGAFSTYNVNYNAAELFPNLISIRQAFFPVSNLGQAWLSDFTGKANLILQVAAFANLSQYYVVSLFTAPSIAGLLALSLMFRTLPFMKGFSNLLLSIIITFLIIMPITFYGESYVFHPPIVSNEISDVTDYISSYNSFSLILPEPSVEARRVIGASQRTGAASIPSIFSQRFYVSTNGGHEVFMADNDGLINSQGDKFAVYDKAVEINSKTNINAAFLAAINLLVAAVSIKTLQIMLGDSDSVIEVFLRWT
ncbi:MAG: hypothetical protein D6769_03485 [Methanobacteriota archaeon]|nr:MAG: hypothetical protein D6769_03485 [Euryarchaeota archaeon]